MSPSGPSVDHPIQPLNAFEIYSRYLTSLQEKQTIQDTKNAVIRYFVPSVGGPIPSAQKRRPITSEEVESAHQFLKTVPLEMFADATDWASKVLEKLDRSPSQRERVCHDLKSLVNWARECKHLAPSKNLIPQDICRHIQVGRYRGLSLKPANAQQIVEKFLLQINDESFAIEARNAIVRFFVPGCGGPVPCHKPALECEAQASFKYLETVPLEHLSEAIPIATAVLKTLGLSEGHGTRVRNALRNLLSWAKTEQYLPDPNAIAPWGGELLPEAHINPKQLEKKTSLTALELYEQYRSHTRESDVKEQELSSLQTGVIRYLIPVLGGPVPNHKRSTPAELQAGLDYLRKIPLKQLLNGIDCVEAESSNWHQATPPRHSLISRLKRWQRWIIKQHGQDEMEKEITPAFNTFYTPGTKRQRKKPGQKLHEKRCPAHALGAKEFPKDYINPMLQKQSDQYQTWRRKNDVAPGTIKVEMEQIRQLMGWLHRYENVELENLCFEKMIANSKLLFQAAGYADYHEYLRQKEIGAQEARSQAEQDKKRVERYLDFTGNNPNSQARRLAVILAVAKFLHQDLLGSDEFPTKRDIPILRRLLDLQTEKKKKSKYTPQTISYGDTSVSWEESIMVMEEARRRVEQVMLCRKIRTRRGYTHYRRPDSAIANELQRFLSIAFCITIPSRSRTFYDLRIGETFREGILRERRFYDAQELRDNGDWEQCKDEIRFYIHHNVQDYKTGKSMSSALLENGGWWAEIPNISFGKISLYDYINRWLEWGRGAKGTVEHNFFFRLCFSPRPLDGIAWKGRIKTIFERWTGVPVPPKNIRKMFTSKFPEYGESASLLLQHSERIHVTHYDMRQTIAKMEPVMQANQQFIQGTLGV